MCRSNIIEFASPTGKGKAITNCTKHYRLIEDQVDQVNQGCHPINRCRKRDPQKGLGCLVAGMCHGIRGDDMKLTPLPVPSYRHGTLIYQESAHNRWKIPETQSKTGDVLDFSARPLESLSCMTPCVRRCLCTCMHTTSDCHLRFESKWPKGFQRWIFISWCSKKRI